MKTAAAQPDAKPLGREALDRIFVEARTHRAWLDRPVSDEELLRIYDLMKWGPTSANCCPARLVFVKSPEAKERLLPCLSPGNVAKVKAAPVTAIVAYDLEFYESLPKLAPHVDARSSFAGNKELIESTSFRNGSLQGAYFIIAARALGFDCGPMSGFDNAKVDAAFFNEASSRGWRSNFVCNVGHGDPGKLLPRQPRLDFAEACRIA